MKLFSKMISNRSKKGFTLVEMLIVIAVLVIIMAVAVPNVAGYVRRIELMELDDSARSIYMAVQNKMTVMKQSGEDLTAIGTDFTSGFPEIFVAPTVADDATPVPEGTTYEESKPKYLRNTKGSDNKLVTLTTIEGQLYNHNYVIEYDATTGRVFGVFYSEEADLGDSMYPTEYMTLASRDFEERLKDDKLVGYYGGSGDLMKVPTGGEVEKPTNIADSTLEKLVFVLEPPEENGAYKSGKYYFEVKITGKDSNNQEHTITIVPYTPGDNSKNFYVEDGKGVVILDSIAPGCGSDNGQWDLPTTKLPGQENKGYSFTNYTLERDFKGWVYIKDETERKKFFSDLANCTPISGMEDKYSPYEHGLDDWGLGLNYDTANHGADGWKYAQYFRIDPGSDIQVTVTRYDEYGTELESPHNCEIYSSYFSLPLGNGSDAKIAAGRHLQNLANYVNQKLVTSCEIMQDIDFSQDTGNYDSWNSSVTYKGSIKNTGSEIKDYSYLYNFKPIFSQFVDASTFIQNFKGNDKTIKYIRIDTVNDPRYNTDTNANTAFFTKLYNSQVGGINFYCPVVIGRGECTAVFAADLLSGSNISDCTIINPIVESSGEYVGSVFGKTASNVDGLSGFNVYVEEIIKSDSDPNSGYFNNYTRNLDERKDRTSITWDDPRNDPYQRFFIKGTGDETYAGGLVGRTGGKINNSAAAVRVISNGYAGGLVGYSGGSIDKSHVGGHTYNGSFVVPKGTRIGSEILADDYYLVNIQGAKGAGGLAAKSDNSHNGCYTTCSVGFTDENKGNCDTFVGMNNTSLSVGNNGYAIGSLINPDTGEIIEVGTMHTAQDFWNSLTALCAQTRVTLENAEVLKKYDETLTAPYPYKTGASNTVLRDGNIYHLGDWPIPQTAISGYGMFYWENEDGTYRIKAVGDFNGQTEASTLCNMMDGKGISNHGYGYFYSSDYVDGSGGTDFTGDDSTGIKNALNSAGLRGVTFKKLSSTGHSDNTFTFTANNGAVTKTFYYNPDFCALSTSSLTEYEIRSFTQLNNLSDNNSYWSKNFRLSHDILFGTGDTLTPIGVNGTPFTGNIDGHLYRIVNAKLQASGSDAGIFGTVENATIKGVVVFNADYTGITLSDNGEKAALGGVVGRALGTSSITNCAFTGKINATSEGDIAVGGIVGIANGEGIELSNCQAVLSDSIADTPDMTVNGNRIVAAGGIAGMYYSSNPLQNCYSGGYITASAPDTNPSREIYVGGIIGTNANASVSIRIEKCYTYYQTDIGDTDYSFPHSIGSNATYSSCFVLGGEWYNIVQSDPVGVTRHDDIVDFISATNSLCEQGNVETTTNAYSDNLVTPFQYKLPAVISDNGKFYHYGKSPAETMVSLGDKRFGIFYWEEEAGTYNIKGCYYKIVSYDGHDSYEHLPFGNLCNEKDTNSITRYGYGYFIGNGVVGKSISGLSGSEIGIDNITALLANSLGDITQEKAKNSFIIKCYDYSESTDVSEQKVSIKLSNNNNTNYDFIIVPGLCYVDKDHDKNDEDEMIYYEIRTAQHLRNLTNVTYNDTYNGGKFKQTHDIIYTGNVMAPVGNSSNPFTGTYDGGCYRIHNLRVQGNADVGLFGYTSNAAINNTFVIDGDIASTGAQNANVGGIVGNANNTEIQNNIYTGSISASVATDNTANIGGIVGYCSGNSISLTNCEASADITVSGEGSANVGGIAGSANIMNIESCYSGGSLELGESLKATVGGIVGDGNSTLTVKNCYTHMYIPKVESGSGVTVHPIGNKINADNCHYIESKHHYANNFDTEKQSGITKHFAFNTINSIPNSSQPETNHTYRVGLTASNNDADRYPMPAVVKDGATFVHYGDWKDIVPLNADTYGVFYWEKEGEDYRVRVCYVEDNALKESIESKDFCTEMDGKPITDFGYGYFHSEAMTMGEIDFNYSTKFSNDPDISEGINNALKKLGFTGITVKWSHGNINKHEDTIVKLKENDKLTSPALKVGGEDVYVKFNLDFCYLGMWTGNKNDDPNPNEPYEIRNNQQLGNIGITNSYLDKTFIQTHDIIYPGNTNSLLEPIGNKYNPFEGTYHGNGYRIVDGWIHMDRGNYVGLFGSTDGATIDGVTMFNADIKVDNLDFTFFTGENIGRLGGIVGFAKDSTIENCAFYGNIKAGIDAGGLPRYIYAVGGIVGYGYGNMSIRNCESVVSTSWTDSKLSASYHLGVGGIAGISSGSIENCYAGGNLQATVGGVFGIGSVNVTAGGIVGCGNIAISKCYSYMNIPNYINVKNPIGNDFTHTPVDSDYRVTYNVEIDNCYCLKGTGFYNHDVNDANITVVENGNISDFAKKLKTIINENDGYRRYNVPAYATDLSNAGTYPLAAVVTDKSGQYVHYGDVAGLIKYEARAFKSGEPHGTVTVTPKNAIPGEEVTLKIKDLPHGYFVDSISITYGNNKTVAYTPAFSPETTEYKFNMPKGNVRATVNINSRLHKIVFTCNPDQGLISYEKDKAVENDPVTFTVVPKTGWKCKSATLVKTSDGTPVEGLNFNPANGTGSFTMPDYDVTVTAEFEEAVVIPEGKCKITVVTEGEGTVTCPAWCDKNSGVGGIFVQPATNWKIDSVKVYYNGGVIDPWNNNGEYQFNSPDVDELTLKVVFAELPKVFAEANHGTVQVNNMIVPNEGMYTENDKYTGFVINPNDGWWCSHIKVVKKNNVTDVVLEIANDNKYYAGGGFTMPKEDVIIIAEFSPK